MRALARVGLVATVLIAVPAAAVTWDVRDLDHPEMGAIKVAVPAAGVVTQGKDLKLVSAAFVSCEKSNGTIAIELANSAENDTTGGLRPAETPRLVCHPRGAAGGGVARGEGIAATWKTNELGDTRARGLAAAKLSRCATIDVLQYVALPVKGGAATSQFVAMELQPAEPGLSEVFAACGQGGAAVATAPAAKPAAPVKPSTAPTPAKPSAAPASPKPSTVPAPVKPATPPAPVPQAPKAVAEAGWQFAITAAQGKTNVRQGPDIASPVVAQLPPSARILVQKGEGAWWKVKPTRGNGVMGYVRDDRFTLE